MDDGALARMVLRAKQREWAEGLDRLPGRPAATVAHERATLREQSAVESGGRLRMEGFSYEPTRERARFSRTRQIIDRVDPGPLEDGTYLEMLSRQAASVELFLLDRIPDPGVAAALDRVLLGTTGEPRSHAATYLVRGVPVIAMSAGMTSAYYQVAKATVLSWLRTQAPDGSLASFSGRIEDTRATLDDDDTPVVLLFQTLVNWLYRAVARPDRSTAPPAAYHLPLTLLINYAERFVLAHEYGHVLVDQLAVLPGAATDLPAAEGHDVEFRADLFAVFMTAGSAGLFDGVAPNIALQGAVLGMKAHEMVDRARSMALGGAPLPASSTHPPFADRVEAVLAAYRQGWERPGDRRLEIAGLLVAADTAEELWQRVEPRLASAVSRGRPLHPVWVR